MPRTHARGLHTCSPADWVLHRLHFFLIYLPFTHTHGRTLFYHHAPPHCIHLPATFFTFRLALLPFLTTRLYTTCLYHHHVPAFFTHRTALRLHAPHTCTRSAACYRTHCCCLHYVAVLHCRTTTTTMLHCTPLHTCSLPATACHTPPACLPYTAYRSACTPAYHLPRTYICLPATVFTIMGAILGHTFLRTRLPAHTLVSLCHIFTTTYLFFTRSHFVHTPTTACMIYACLSFGSPPTAGGTIRTATTLVLEPPTTHLLLPPPTYCGFYHHTHTCSFCLHTPVISATFAVHMCLTPHTLPPLHTCLPASPVYMPFPTFYHHFSPTFAYHHYLPLPGPACHSYLPPFHTAHAHHHCHTYSFYLGLVLPPHAILPRLPPPPPYTYFFPHKFVLIVLDFLVFLSICLPTYFACMMGLCLDTLHSTYLTHTRLYVKHCAYTCCLCAARAYTSTVAFGCLMP